MNGRPFHRPAYRCPGHEHHLCLDPKSSSVSRVVPRRPSIRPPIEEPCGEAENVTSKRRETPDYMWKGPTYCPIASNSNERSTEAPQGHDLSQCSPTGPPCH